MPLPPIWRHGSLQAGRANPSGGHATCCDDAEREACSLINQLVRLYSTIPRFASSSCQIRFGRSHHDPANSPHALINLPFQVRRNRMTRRLLFVIALSVLFSPSTFSQAPKLDRQVAVMIDDLPAR